MPRSIMAALAALGIVALFAGGPSAVEAQVRISVEWNGARSGGPYVYAEYGSGGAYVVGSFGRPNYRYHGPRSRYPVHVRRGVRIPPGHLPGPGECRVWYPNRPPGHQPPPFRCSDRYHGPYDPGYGYGGYEPGYGYEGGYGPAYRSQPANGQRYAPEQGYTPRYGPVTTPREVRGAGPVAGSDARKRWKKLERAALAQRRDLKRGSRGQGRGPGGVR